MSKVVNLNKFRKDKARSEKRALADENAVKFGRTKGQKLKEAAEKRRSDSLLDGHKKDDDG